MPPTRKVGEVPAATIEDPDKYNDLFPPFTVEDSEGKLYGGTFGRLREAVAFARKYVNENPGSPFLGVFDNRKNRLVGVEPVQGIWTVPTELLGDGIKMTAPGYDDPRIEK